MAHKFNHLTCDNETLEKINEFKEIWLSSHPEFSGMQISQNFILRKMVDVALINYR
jgi:hypothetical protein